jgi:hypothetical protein
MLRNDIGEQKVVELEVSAVLVMVMVSIAVQ